MSLVFIYIVLIKRCIVFMWRVFIINWNWKLKLYVTPQRRRGAGPRKNAPQKVTYVYLSQSTPLPRTTKTWGWKRRVRWPNGIESLAASMRSEEKEPATQRIFCASLRWRGGWSVINFWNSSQCAFLKLNARARVLEWEIGGEWESWDIDGEVVGT